MRRLIIVGVVLATAVASCKENLPSTLAPDQTVTMRGELGAGTECPMLIVGRERRFSLSGELGRFKAGDRVCIHGTVAQMSFCMEGEATIAIVSIAPENSCP